MAGTALFHPPKSSSAAILGADEASNPELPLKPLLAAELPLQPKSLFGADDADGDFTGCTFVAVVGGSGVAHSFEPHGSLLAKPEKAVELV